VSSGWTFKPLNIGKGGRVVIKVRGSHCASVQIKPMFEEETGRLQCGEGPSSETRPMQTGWPRWY